MSVKEEFISEIRDKYRFKGDKIILGKAMLADEVLPEAEISIALRTLNRHGLIAGATGTGKTKTLQILAEQLSLKGIPTLMMDVKGDLSGIAQPGDLNGAIKERMEKLKMDYSPEGTPVELLSISEEKGVRMRATVLEFGPLLFSKILELNETQSSILSIIFKFCEDEGFEPVTLEDLKDLVLYIGDEGKESFKRQYGNVSTASTGAIIRKIVALEQQGAAEFFGKPSFEIEDLIRLKDGKGVGNIIRLTDIQNKPGLFSTFMLNLLTQIYDKLPEEGDLDQPKLVLFIDEAHLVFSEAEKALLNKINTIIKLIRSKGVGIIFCTQTPGDIPDTVLSQLGLKIQHALRGFTARDRKEIQKAVENYPISKFYAADEVITRLGIGEAFVTGLNEKGIPTPLAHTFLRAPLSRMDVLNDTEINEINADSELVKKYSKEEKTPPLKDQLAKLTVPDTAPTPAKPKTVKKTTRRKNSQVKTSLLAVIRSYAMTIGNTLIRDYLKKKK